MDRYDVVIAIINKRVWLFGGEAIAHYGMCVAHCVRAARCRKRPCLFVDDKWFMPEIFRAFLIYAIPSKSAISSPSPHSHLIRNANEMPRSSACITCTNSPEHVTLYRRFSCVSVIGPKESPVAAGLQPFTPLDAVFVWQSPSLDATEW